MDGSTFVNLFFGQLWVFLQKKSNGYFLTHPIDIQYITVAKAPLRKKLHFVLYQIKASTNP